MGLPTVDPCTSRATIVSDAITEHIVVDLPVFVCALGPCLSDATHVVISPRGWIDSAPLCSTHAKQYADDANRERKS